MDLPMPVPIEMLRELSVNETIRRWPATVAVFNEFGIDACCGGAVANGDAAARDGAQPARVLAALVQAIGGDAA